MDIYMEFVALHKVDNIIYKPFLIGEDSSSLQSTISGGSGSGSRAKGEGAKDIALRYRLFKPFYGAFIQLKRTLFKLSYKPPVPKRKKHGQ